MQSGPQVLPGLCPRGDCPAHSVLAPGTEGHLQRAHATGALLSPGLAGPHFSRGCGPVGRLAP